MKFDSIIVDADICIKLGSSGKYPYLQKLLSVLSKKVYIHLAVYNEIMQPVSAKEQIDALIRQNIVEIIDSEDLNGPEKDLYTGTYNVLSGIMMDKNMPHKNKGETCSLAMAKTKSIRVFATDEMNLQPIIDHILNVTKDEITCLRIIDIIKMIHNNEIEGFIRRDAKMLWRLSGKKTSFFDQEIWPL